MSAQSTTTATRDRHAGRLQLRPSFRVPDVVASVCALVLVASVAAVGMLLLQHRGHEGDAAARREVLSVAATVTPQVLSYDYSALDEYRARVADLTTGHFRDDITELIDATIKPKATAERIVTQATVPAVSIVSGTEDRVTVLAFVNQVTRKKGAKAPLIEGSRVRVEFVKVGSDWKIAEFEPV